MRAEETRQLVDRAWKESILPALHNYIRIPNLSPMFDPEWESTGHMERALQLAAKWAQEKALAGAKVEILRLPGRTPVLLIEVAGSRPGNVMLYGHLDKQPPFDGWREEDGLGPWTPVELDGRLYGRGSADDGYAVFSIVAAVEAVQKLGSPHPRLVAVIECSEESGSPDLPAYMEAFADRIGIPSLVICLDSGCGDYERLWNTTSLRGLIAGDLTVRILREGVHSGDASGIVPSSFRILRMLLDRLEDATSGQIRPTELGVEIPPLRREQAKVTSRILGDSIHESMPFLEGAGPVSRDLAELILNRTWRPALSITAQDGMPPCEQGGNVLRPFTTLKLSLRIAPTLDAKRGTEFLATLLTENPPYGARVEFKPEKSSQGWEAPPRPSWLEKAVDEASLAYFGKPAADLGEGGSIPFMALLGEKFPKANFLITGVLGPGSNAHGPNEFLDIATAKGVTSTVAHLLATFEE
jgi:acetylornithine deacetylase/succinyl-diaminopimelate desuccinylase-like protein